MLEEKTLIMVRIIGGLWWSHLYQIQLLVISSRRAFRRDPEQQYNQITGEKNFRETKWFMNGGDGKPEDTGSLPLSRDRLDHGTPPPPFQPGKLLSFLKIDWSQKLGTVHKLDLIRMTSTRISRENHGGMNILMKEPQNQRRWFRGLLVWPLHPKIRFWLFLLVVFCVNPTLSGHLYL